MAVIVISSDKLPLTCVYWLVIDECGFMIALNKLTRAHEWMWGLFIAKRGGEDSAVKVGDSATATIYDTVLVERTLTSSGYGYVLSG